MKIGFLVKRNIIFASSLLLLYIIHSALLAPIYSYICTDVIYSEGYLPIILEISLDIFQMLIWCILFSFIISNFYLEETKSSYFVLIFTAIATALRYFLQPMISFMASEMTSAYLLSDALFYFFFDFIQITVITILCAMIIRRRSDFEEKIRIIEKMNGNPKRVRALAIISAALISIVKIGMRVRFDLFYGAPESINEVFLMAAYYLSDVFYGIISYLIIIILLNMQCRKNGSV